jgi:hypothetical protein
VVTLEPAFLSPAFLSKQVDGSGNRGSFSFFTHPYACFCFLRFLKSFNQGNTMDNDYLTRNANDQVQELATVTENSLSDVPTILSLGYRLPL